MAGDSGERFQPFLREFALQQVTIRDICRRMSFIGQSSDPIDVRVRKTFELLQKGYRLLDTFRAAGIRFIQELHSMNQSSFTGQQQEKNAILCEQLRGKLVAVFDSWDNVIQLMSEDPRVRRHNDLV